MFWSLLQNVGGKGITFVVFIILARLLTPEIFGLIGMLMIFIQLSQVLVRAGFSQALIQKKDTDEEDYSSVFWINLAVSILIYGILFFSAPLIANFYGQPILTKLTRALSLVFVINAFSYVQTARLQKKISFKTLTIIHIPSTILGGAVGIGMAIMGYGVWSIVGLQLVTRGAYAVQIWFYGKWKPLLSFNKTNAKELFSFGSKLMISAILNTAYKNIYLVVIGKFFPVSAVGYYYNANRLVRTPSLTFSSALNKVIFPAFSSVQDNNKKLKKGYKKLMQQVLFWLCPIFVLSGVLAVPLFRFVFTEKWLPAVPYFRILCIVGILYPLNLYNLNIINVKGRSDLFLKLEIFKKAVITVGVFIAIQFSIWVLLIFQAVNSIFGYIINSYFSGHFIQYGVLEQIKDILPVFLLSACVGIIIYFLDQSLLNIPDIIRLLIGFGLGGVLYWVAAKVLKLDPYVDFIPIFRAKIYDRFMTKS